MIDFKTNDQTTERNNQIYKMVKAGETYRGAALKFKITGERVRQIVKKIDYLKKHKEGKDPFWFIPTRVSHDLSAAGIEPKDVVNMKDEELLKIRDIGPATIKYLREI